MSPADLIPLKAKTFSQEKTLLVLIILLALGLRLYGIASPLYDYNAWRQTETAAIAYNYYADHLPFLYPEVDWVGPHGHAEMEFPLFPYMISCLYFFFGVWDGWGRVLSVLCSLGTIYVLWDLGKRAFGGLAGVYTAAFFALSPLTVYFGRTFQPDMMMVFCSTLALSLAWRWDGSLKSGWLYASAAALAAGVLLKPPCLIVAFPLLWIFFQRKGLRLFWAGESWLYALIALLPAVLWYAHARQFYEETGASFMWHYKNFDADRVFFSVWTSTEFWRAVAFRISDQIFVYLGLLPFGLGLLAMARPQFRFPFAWLWLFGVLILYMGVAAHHIGHDYYSLLAVPPLALIAGYGCSALGGWIYHRIAVAPVFMLILPLVMGVLGFVTLLDRDWYGKFYRYYDDAVALREKIPQDALILVMDELLHTPEFFYFINRNGWHRYRSPHDKADDSAWLEQKRDLGATVYFGLTEDSRNNPMHYLQNHVMGRYIRSHYRVQEIGYRYFTARLDQPLYGKHLYQRYDNKILALPEPLLYQHHHAERDWVSLNQWPKADALLLDFHSNHQESIEQLAALYEKAQEDGFRIAHQGGGRLVLERGLPIAPRPNLIEQVIRSTQAPRVMENGRMVLGVLPPGQYRLSMELSLSPAPQTLKLFVFDMQARIYAQRTLETVHMQHIKEGERPGIVFELDEPMGLYATVDAPSGPINPKSFVCMPAVQCLPPQVVQAEQLIAYHATPVKDPEAIRQTALRNVKEPLNKAVVIGPYFDFPDGHYRFLYRLREDTDQSRGVAHIGLYQSDDTWRQEKTLPFSEISRQYADYAVESPLSATQTIESRLYVSENAQVLLDTVTYQQTQYGHRHFPKSVSFSIAAAGENAFKVSEYGRRYMPNGTEGEPLMAFGRIVESAWSEKTGLLVLDEHGCVYNEGHSKVACFPSEAIDNAAAFELSPDGSRLGLLTSERKVYLWHSGQIQALEAPPHPDPVYDLLVENDGGVLVLYGNGEVRALGKADPPQGLPLFWADVARALVRHEHGVYVIDNAGAIHPSEGVPPLLTPVYKPEDWVLDAARTTQGQWVLQSQQGELIVFDEPQP